MRGVSRRRRRRRRWSEEHHGDRHRVLRRLLLQLLLQPQLLLARSQSQDRLHAKTELHVQGGGDHQDHGREVHRQPRRLPARHPGDLRPPVRHRRRDRLLLPGHRPAQPLRALRRAGRHRHRRPHLLLGPGARHLPLHPQLPLLPTGQQDGRRRPLRRWRGDVDGARGGAEHVLVLLPALAVAAHPVLHAAAVVPAHTVLHAAAAGVPVPAAADTVLHAAFAATAGFPFPSAAMAMDATVGATSTSIPVPSFATDFLNTVSAATAAACIPIPFAADSAPTSFSAVSATTVAVLTTASSAPATTSAAFVSLAFPATAFLPSNSKPFHPISSTFKALKHLILFPNSLTKYKTDRSASPRRLPAVVARPDMCGASVGARPWGLASH